PASNTSAWRNSVPSSAKSRATCAGLCTAPAPKRSRTAAMISSSSLAPTVSQSRCSHPSIISSRLVRAVHSTLFAVSASLRSGRESGQESSRAHERGVATVGLIATPVWPCMEGHPDSLAALKFVWPAQDPTLKRHWCKRRRNVCAGLLAVARDVILRHRGRGLDIDEVAIVAALLDADQEMYGETRAACDRCAHSRHETRVETAPVRWRGRRLDSQPARCDRVRVCARQHDVRAVERAQVGLARRSIALRCDVDEAEAQARDRLPGAVGKRAAQVERALCGIRAGGVWIAHTRAGARRRAAARTLRIDERRFDLCVVLN